MRYSVYGLGFRVWDSGLKLESKCLGVMLGLGKTPRETSKPQHKVIPKLLK